jgi:hypothetical protein
MTAAVARDRYKALGELLRWLVDLLGIEVVIVLGIAIVVGGGWLYFRSVHEKMKR